MEREVLSPKLSLDFKWSLVWAENYRRLQSLTLSSLSKMSSGKAVRRFKWHVIWKRGLFFFFNQPLKLTKNSIPSIEVGKCLGRKRLILPRHLRCDCVLSHFVQSTFPHNALLLGAIGYSPCALLHRAGAAQIWGVQWVWAITPQDALLTPYPQDLAPSKDSMKPGWLDEQMNERSSLNL